MGHSPVEVRVFSPTLDTPWAPPLGVSCSFTGRNRLTATRLQMVLGESVNRTRGIRGVQRFGSLLEISTRASRGAIQSARHTLLVLVAK